MNVSAEDRMYELRRPTKWPPAYEKFDEAVDLITSLADESIFWPKGLVKNLARLVVYCVRKPPKQRKSNENNRRHRITIRQLQGQLNEIIKKYSAIVVAGILNHVSDGEKKSGIVPAAAAVVRLLSSDVDNDDSTGNVHLLLQHQHRHSPLYAPIEYIFSSSPNHQSQAVNKSRVSSVAYDFVISGNDAYFKDNIDPNYRLSFSAMAADERQENKSELTVNDEMW
jgi:hypothetical protein